MEIKIKCPTKPFLSQEDHLDKLILLKKLVLSVKVSTRINPKHPLNKVSTKNLITTKSKMMKSLSEIQALDSHSGSRKSITGHLKR